MSTDRNPITLDLLMKEIESLKRARDILCNIYATNAPYPNPPIILACDWKDMQDYFGFDDSE